MNTLLSPAQLVWPALYPIATLKQVSASDAAPALVPAYKLYCESATHPSVEPPPVATVITALLAPDAVAVTDAPWKSKIVIEPAVPTLLDSSCTVIPLIRVPPPVPDKLEPSP